MNMCVCVCVSRSVVFDSLPPMGHQAPLSMEFSRQEYWSGSPFPSPGQLPHPGIKPKSLALQADSLPSQLPGNMLTHIFTCLILPHGEGDDNILQYSCLKNSMGRRTWL